MGGHPGTKDQLIARFIEPYEQGNPIVINGKTIDPDDLERIKISESDRTIESFIPQIRAEAQRSSVAVIGWPSYTYRAIGRAKDVTDDFIEGPVGYKKEIASSSALTSPSKQKNKNKVFIVHGYDEVAQTKTARFVEKMGFEAIILHEKASSGRTIIEKIEYRDG